jgi:hypothetical protein
VSDDLALSEKRVYEPTREGTVAYVACEVGLARVEIAGDQVGRFELAARDPARDVAGGDGRLVVAGEDVRVGTGEGFVATGFGEAVAVSIADGQPLAASPDGRVARLRGDEWTTVGRVEEPRALDGDLLVTEADAYWVGDGLEPLEVADPDPRDVAAAGPYVAGGEGLYRVADGVERVRPGRHEAVWADRERAHLLADGTLSERDETGWTACSLPVAERVVDLAYGASVCAVTAAGTMLVSADPEQTPDGHGGWRSRALGVRGVTAVAAV